MKEYDDGGCDLSARILASLATLPLRQFVNKREGILATIKATARDLSVERLEEVDREIALRWDATDRDAITARAIIKDSIDSREMIVSKR